MNYADQNAYRALLDKRLAIETRAMRSRFPEFELRKADKELRRHRWLIAKLGQMFWLGSLKTYGGARYLIAAVYPSDYPFSEICAYVLEPYLPASEHRFRDGHLCLYQHQGAGQGFESDKSTAVTIIAWSAAWLHAYEIWRSSGQWPTLSSQKEKTNVGNSE